jgi:hypothetical protein
LTCHHHATPVGPGSTLERGVMTRSSQGVGSPSAKLVPLAFSGTTLTGKSSHRAKLFEACPG